MDAALKAFQKDYPLSVDLEWFRQCVAFLEQEEGPQVKQQKDKLHKMIYQQALMSDFNIMGSGCLPNNVSEMAKGVVQGPFIVQVDEIITISDAYEHWYKDVENRVLKLCITDGKQKIFGMEYERIHELSVNTSPGIKAVITNVNVRRGLLLLTPKNIRLLGGEVEDLVELEKKKRQQWENRNKGTFLPTTNADNTTRQMQNNKITAASKTAHASLLDDDDFPVDFDFPTVTPTTTKQSSSNPTGNNTSGNVSIHYGGFNGTTFTDKASNSEGIRSSYGSSSNPYANNTTNSKPNYSTSTIPKPTNTPYSNPPNPPPSTSGSEFDDFIFDADFELPPNPSSAASNNFTPKPTPKIPPPPIIPSTPEPETPSKRSKLSLSLSRSQRDTPARPLQSVPASPLSSFSTPAPSSSQHAKTEADLIVIGSPEPPFVYIRDLEKTRRQRTALIKAAVTEVVPGFQFRGGYNLDVKIEDGSACVLASLSDGIINDLLGIPCEEFGKRWESQLPHHKNDIANRSKGMEEKLKVMEGVMTVQVEPLSTPSPQNNQQTKYNILDVRIPSRGQTSDMYNYLTMR